MAEAAAPPPLHHGHPDEITIWEILVRLPPKALLLCRVWRRVTSTRDFLLAHHGRQPTLPLLYRYNFIDYDGHSVDLVPFDHRAGVAATDRLRSVARLGHAPFRPFASCDGLLVLSINNCDFVICNPATRQYDALMLPCGFIPLGMYPHSPTGEYRILLYWDQKLSSEESDAKDGSYVFALGLGQPSRHIGEPDLEELIFTPSFLFRGSLHWHLQQYENGNNMIMVFNPAAESFREMRTPVLPGFANLFEIDGMLGISNFNDAASTIDIWMAQDYGSEVWALKYRVELPVAEIRMQFGKFAEHWNVVVPSWNGDFLVLVKFGEWLLQVDMDGKLVASFHRKGLNYTRLRLKQTLVSHTFFPTLERYVVNAWPFI